MVQAGGVIGDQWQLNLSGYSQIHMNPEPLLTHQSHLQKLEPFCRALNRALEATGLPPEKVLESWRAAVTAKCVICGIEISGEELFALSQPPSAERASAKIGRLRLGDCARQGCNSYYYNLEFRPSGQLNWLELFGRADAIEEKGRAENRREHGVRNQDFLMLNLLMTRRIGLAVIVAVLLAVVRQWYVGGRIPLIREPEKFLAAPAEDARVFGGD